MSRRDLLAAAASLLAAAVVIRESTALAFGSVRNPGPGFLPLWAGATLAGLALVLLGQALRARSGAGARAVPAAGNRGGWRRVVGLLLALALYVLALDPVGYPTATFLLVLAILRPAAWRAVLPAVGLAALAAGGSYLLFAVWLKVPLPPGPFLG